MQSSNKSKQHELLQRQFKEQYKDQANLNNTNSYEDSLKNNTKIKQRWTTRIPTKTVWRTIQRPNKSKQHELLQRESEEEYKDQTNLKNTTSYKDSLKNNTKIKQI
jgi:hypothetical protein